MTLNPKTYLDQEEFYHITSRATIFEGIEKSTSPEYADDLRSFIDSFRRNPHTPEFWDRMAQRPGKSTAYDMLKSMSRPKIEWLLSNILQELSQYKNQKILDIGCGTGLESVFLAEVFRGSHVFGCDTSLEMVQRATERAYNRNLDNTSFFQADRDYLPLKQNCFDALICLNTLTEGDSCQGRMAEIYRVLSIRERLNNFRSSLKKDGKLIISQPLAYYKEQFKDYCESEKWFFSNVLEGSGFKKQRIMHINDKEHGETCLGSLFISAKAV